jgi:hypothetical protein
VTNAENVKTLYMDEKGTRTEYLLRFLNNRSVGLADTITVTDDERRFLRVAPPDYMCAVPKYFRGGI